MKESYYEELVYGPCEYIVGMKDNGYTSKTSFDKEEAHTAFIALSWPINAPFSF